MDLYKQLGHEKQQTKTSGHTPTSLEGTIKKGINESTEDIEQFIKDLDANT